MPLYGRQRRHCRNLGEASHVAAEQRRAEALTAAGNTFIAKDQKLVDVATFSQVNSVEGRFSGDVGDRAAAPCFVIETKTTSHGRISGTCPRPYSSTALKRRKNRNEGRACAGAEQDELTRASEGVLTAFSETTKDAIPDKRFGEFHRAVQHALHVHSGITHGTAKESVGLVIGSVAIYHVDRQSDIAPLYNALRGEVLYEKAWPDKASGWNGVLQFRNNIVANAAVSRRDLVTASGRPILTWPLQGETYENLVCSPFVHAYNIPPIMIRRSEILGIMINALSPYDHSFEGNILTMEFKSFDGATVAGKALDRFRCFGCIIYTSSTRL